MTRTLLGGFCLVSILVSLSSCKSEDIVCNLENDVVRQYMSHGPYEYFGSRESYFRDREEFPVLYAQDDPRYVDISWPGSPHRSYAVTVKEGGRTVYEGEVQDTVAHVQNLIPQRKYTFTVKDARRTVRHGTIRTEGQVRMLNIDESCNVRDLGGWTGLGGKKVRYGWLYRCGSIDGTYTGISGEVCKGPDRCDDPNHDAAQDQVGNTAYYTLSDASLKQISDAGIRAELDLRGTTGIGAWGRQCMSHSRSLGHSQVPGIDFVSIMTDEALFDPLGYPAVVRDVQWIIDELKKGNPVAFHCRSGADRTGAVAFTIEALLGVSSGDIARDYELTTLSSEGKGQVRDARSTIEHGYIFFGQGPTTLEVTDAEKTSVLQRQAYRYLNCYFDDARISADDLDYLIDFMLEAHIARSLRPQWAI